MPRWILWYSQVGGHSMGTAALLECRHQKLHDCPLLLSQDFVIMLLWLVVVLLYVICYVFFSSSYCHCLLLSLLLLPTLFSFSFLSTPITEFPGHCGSLPLTFFLLLSLSSSSSSSASSSSCSSSYCSSFSSSFVFSYIPVVFYY